jgi:MFS superfamily sulfate permease-like transporter
MVLPITSAAAAAAPLRPAESWPRALLAGAVAALTTLALLLSLGVLAFLPLGGEAAHYGTAAVFTTSALSALVYAVGASSRLPTGAPTAPSVLIVATLVATLLKDPAVQADPAARMPWVLAGVVVTVVLMGMVQVGIGLLGLVQLVRKVPQTVLAGFMNAIAALVLMAQAGPLLGFTTAAFTRDGLAVLSQFRPGPLVLGAGTALIVWTLMARRPRWPAALLALIIGVAVHALASRLVPGLDLGPTVDALSSDLPVVQAWTALGGAGCRELLAAHAATLVSTGVALALVGVLESILVVLALDQQFGDRTDTRRELICIGAANVVGGLCGALPLGTVRSRAAAMLQAGGASWRAAAAISVCSALLFLLGSPLIAWLPRAVLGGVMVTVAWALVDPWTRGLLRQAAAGERSLELGMALAVVAFVLITTVWRGPLFGVGIGIVLAVLLFIRQLSGSLVRQRYSALQRPSRRVYPAEIEAQLRPLRPAIAVLELEGALFFGNAEQLNHAADALQAGTCWLVVDLRRVSTVDVTGAHVLAQLASRLQRRSIGLLLAGVQHAQPLGRRLQLFGVGGEDGVSWLPDADYAIEVAERALLAVSEPDATAAAALGENALLADLSAEDLSVVQAHLHALTLAPGERVFRQGDAADALYLVMRGSVSIVAPTEGQRQQRYASLSPGTLFGEAALLDGGGRAADAMADCPTELLRLDQAALLALAGAHPELGARIYRNMARYLARRLRIASAAWAAAAG